MNRQNILDRINEIIIEEKGKAIHLDNQFIDSELDSLGTMIVLATVDAEFSIFPEDMSDENAFDELDIPTLTMRDLVNKCKLAIINTSSEQKSVTDTMQFQS